ncbi:MAG: hypothetical protein BWX58_01674 [Deltaproteobacteria bacterium ADurb.Bin026]|nr:MAG: hypothetical protein BWX58_01674 [Deltaproteobacteria bacterium ADurb.Bin026]
MEQRTINTVHLLCYVFQPFFGRLKLLAWMNKHVLFIIKQECVTFIAYFYPFYDVYQFGDKDVSRCNSNNRTIFSYWFSHCNNHFFCSCVKIWYGIDNRATLYCKLIPRSCKTVIIVRRYPPRTCYHLPVCKPNIHINYWGFSPYLTFIDTVQIFFQRHIVAVVNLFIHHNRVKNSPIFNKEHIQFICRFECCFRNLFVYFLFNNLIRCPITYY